MPDAHRLSRRASIRLRDTLPSPPDEAPRFDLEHVLSKGDPLKGAAFYGMDPIDTTAKHTLFRLAADIDSPSVDRVADVLVRAAEHLNAGLEHDFHYTIKEQTAHLSGNTADEFFQTVRNYETVRKRMGDAVGTSFDAPSDQSPPPRAVAVTRCSAGLLWVEITPRAVCDSPSLQTATVGIVLPNIPFDDTSLKEFFQSSVFESPPDTYEQEIGAKEVTLQFPDHELENVRELEYEQGSDEGVAHVVATNPCYKQASQLTDQVGDDVPDRLLRAISSVERIPFRVSSDISSVDPEGAFSVKQFTVLRLELSEPLHLFRTACTARTNQ